MDNESMGEEEESCTDVEEVEEMLYCSIYHEHANTKEDRYGVIKREHSNEVSIEERKGTAPMEQKGDAQSRQDKDLSKESVPIISVADCDDSLDDVQCLGIFPAEKDKSGNKKCSLKSGLSDDSPTELNKCVGSTSRAAEKVRASDFEEGEITTDSDDSPEVEVICEKRYSKKNLEEGEVDSDDSTQETVNAKCGDTVLPRTGSAVKSGFTINVEYSKPWPLYDPDFTLSDNEQVRTCSCSGAPLQTDLFHSDSDVSEDFSVTAIQETMSDCCWQVSEEDRYPERRLILDDLIECKICGLTGHRKYDCPEYLQPTSCCYCGRRSHRAPDSMSQCPNAVCLLCWAKGHVEQKCPRQWIKDNVCDLCSSTGHTGMQCPRWWNGHYDKENSGHSDGVEEEDHKNLFCCNCSGKGHCYEECKLPRPSYHDYRAFAEDASDSEDEMKMSSSQSSSKDEDSFLWSLNVCSVDKNESDSVSDNILDTPKLTFRDFLKKNSIFRRGGEAKGRRRRVNTFQSFLKEMRLKRKRQKKHRKERKKLELMYGKVGGDEELPDAPLVEKERRRKGKRKRTSTEGERKGGKQKGGGNRYFQRKFTTGSKKQKIGSRPLSIFL